MAKDKNVRKQEDFNVEAKRIYADTIEGMQQITLNFSQARQFIQNLQMDNRGA